MIFKCLRRKPTPPDPKPKSLRTYLDFHNHQPPARLDPNRASFFDLPGEIRNQIYHLYFTSLYEKSYTLKINSSRPPVRFIWAANFEPLVADPLKRFILAGKFLGCEANSYFGTKVLTRMAIFRNRDEVMKELEKVIPEMYIGKFWTNDRRISTVPKSPV
jgi:hypothetical protein